MKYFLRFLLLMLGVALATAGLLAWHARDFALLGLWSLEQGLHPLIFMVIGLAMIPPTLWEILILEVQAGDE